MGWPWLRRIRDTGSIPTPFWTYVHYHGEKWREYGAAKMEWMFAHRSFLDCGIPVPGASDYTPGPFAPLMAIQSMVTRRDFEGRVWGPSQRVTVDEALRIGTLHGARASCEERDKGSIAAGKLADRVDAGGSMGHLAAAIELTWIVLVSESSVPTTATFFPANSLDFSWSLNR